MPLDTPSSRRSILKAGAWSAPLVVVAAAAPALAASPISFTVSMGSTRSVFLTPEQWFAIDHAGASVAAGPTAIPAGALTMQVSYAPEAAGASYQIWYDWMIPGWTLTSSNPGPVLTVVNAATIPAGTALPIASTGGRNGSSIYYDVDPSPAGTFSILFKLGNEVRGPFTYSTQGAPTARGVAGRRAASGHHR